jgi:hypothetical protein
MFVASDGVPRIGRLKVTTDPQQLSLPDGQTKNSQGVLFKVLGDDATVFIGTTSNVSPQSGYPVSTGEEFSINLVSTTALWIVADSEVEIAWCSL